MSIRVRLVLSYIAMLLVPLVLLGIAVMILIVALLGDVRSVYKLNGSHMNPIGAILKQQSAVEAEIQLRSRDNPDSLLDSAVQAGLEESLNAINMELIVRKEDDVRFASPKLAESGLLNRLPAYGEANSPMEKSGRWERKEEGRSGWFIAQQQDTVFSDGSRGSVFMAMDFNVLGRFAHRYFSLFLLSLLAILVLTNGLLTYFVSRSIIRPLRSLKKAADQIKEGHLDFAVKPESKDEIGELAASFEQMRSRLKESVERQLQYEENRKELISNISHDLKTPITAIKGYVEGIIDGVTNTPEKLDKYVRTIHTKSMQLDRLIDELFLFSKLDLNSQPFHFEPVDLIAFLQDCTDELQMDIEKQGVSFRFVTEPGLAEAWTAADRDQLKRVLVNMIENAMKYMDKEHGTIRLRIADAGEHYIVEVEDNGQGIAAESLPHIFDRFYRADRSRNASTGGSGLGLSIAKQIIEGHGGVIGARSEPGKGTVIWFTLDKRKDDRSGGEGHEQPHIDHRG
ncbi:Alkaline phosphatase synthesis sensor protein PhoR [Paenibacillus konkukensis]|uniref:histidine kinase n=1 Tax=Paenibacillus konkukensis TaxID=2020716 RepID=A0ABY4RPN9_9BACL|nr:HAMP domain-containing sensor histidine kinase [Paenibacillus konkukensis]UQZ83533.1 Alkaline phosphatase synthesis sensor protein PhoR [Paenibacillus konkukensis]